MSASVTFEWTPFFSSSVEDFSSIQQVLPIPLVDSSIPCAPNNSIPVQNPPKPSSPPFITYQCRTQMTSPMLKGESSSSSSSRLLLNTMAPINDDSA